MNKLLDLRFVIGVFFGVMSLLLLGYSFFSDAHAAAHTVNRWCGAVFGVFGVLMVVLSFRKDAHDELT